MADLRGGIIEAAKAIGANPLDLATVISYETGGTFDPLQRGPTTQWGQHRGLIQFGEPQARQYGVNWDDPLGSQLGADGAIVRYFRESGYKPGMGLLDLYSTVNAGAPGLYNRTDANNGGAPGTVRDKVETQMEGHRRRAAALLGEGFADGPQIAAETMAALGIERPEMAQNEQSGGLLGQASTRNPSGGIWDRLGGGVLADPDRRARIAMALEGMTTNPNVPYIQALQGGVEQRREDTKTAEQKAQQEQQKNATIAWLRSQGRDDLAAAMSAGLPAGAAFEMALKRNEAPTTDDIKEYNFAVGQGFQGSFADWQLENRRAGATTVTVGGQEVQRVGDNALVPDPNSPAGVRAVPIPGTDTARKIEQEERDRQAATERQQTATGTRENRLSTVARDIDRAVALLDRDTGILDLPEAGVAGNLLARTGLNQEAVDLSNILDNLQGTIAFERLQEMRNASATGGALGQVTERELALLMSAYGSLAQSTSPAMLRENLTTIKKIMTKIENDPVARNFYYGGSGQAAPTGDFSVTGRID